MHRYAGGGSVRLPEYAGLFRVLAIFVFIAIWLGAPVPSSAAGRATDVSPAPTCAYDDWAPTSAPTTNGVASLADQVVRGPSEVQGHLYDVSANSVATNALLTPGRLADDVAEAVGGVAKPATSGTGQVITIPQGNRQIVIRIMEEGGGRTNYYRVSVAGKEALTVMGEASVDRALTHIPIGESSLDDILRLVNQLAGGGG
ncbi:MAG: hypothetical protein GXP34_04735 [Actinobacteria bacterium]|nr:hypothetical protein [Actinomycetota bacterium]